MGKKIVLKDDSKNLVKVDLKIFIDHINYYHKTGTSIHEKETAISQLTKRLGRN